MLNFTIYSIVHIILSYAILSVFMIIMNDNIKLNKFQIFIIFLSCVFLSAPDYTLSILKINSPGLPLRLIMGVFWINYRIISYSIIFKKISKMIFYVSLLFYIIDQIYVTMLRYLLSTNGIKHNTIAYAVEAISVFIALMIIKKYKLKDILQKNISCVKSSSYILILLFTFILSLFISFSTNKEEYMIQILGFLTLIIIPAIVGLVIKISISSKEHEETALLLTKQLESQVEYYETINKLYSEFRSFRHDFKNHILCLRSILEHNEINQALEYLNDIETLSHSTKPQYNTGNIIIDALITHKNENASSYNARIDFKGFIPTIGITKVDLCIIFANALDNAVEACSRSENLSNKIMALLHCWSIGSPEIHATLDRT